MGFFDFFRFTPPKHEEFEIFLKNYLSKDQHILECYGDIIGSGCVNGLKLDYDLFSKHFKAIQIQMLLACIEKHLEGDNYDNFYQTINEVVNTVDGDIWSLVKKTYKKSYNSGGVSEMVESLNKKPFKERFDNNVKSNLINGMVIMEEQFDILIKAYL